MAIERPRCMENSEGDQVVSLGPMVGTSPIIRELFAQIRSYAQTEFPVLITGESGTGKELVARTVHLLSSRHRGPFIPVNCGSLSPNIANSELFGHVRGAFTGADRARKGAFHSASGGSLFLDEFGELSLNVQASLLRTLETGDIRQLGSDSSSRSNVRLICATNVDLWGAADRGTFRDDLLFRVDVLRLHVPPLRDRLTDLDVLVPHLLSRLPTPTGIEDEALALLKSYHWPGNVRELRNVLTRCVIRSAEYRQIKSQHVSDILLRLQPNHRGSDQTGTASFRLQTFDAVSQCLHDNAGNRKTTYQSLGIPRSTFYRWLREGKIVDR